MPTRKKSETSADQPQATPKSPSSGGRGRAKSASKPVPETGLEQATPKRRTKSAASEEVAPQESKRAGGRSFDLVIVESPAKAKTINKYLGPNFLVLASYGHVRDLPGKGKLRGEEVTGVRISDGWLPRYVVQDKADLAAASGSRGGKGGNRKSPREILDEIGREAARANRVFLASDPDREGEAIAWHIADELKLDPSRTYRIRFNEITKAAVQQALQSPTQIDMDRVKAQEARRVLDRVVGYPLSDLLGAKVTRGLSAGRVQSVAVRLVVEREREIEAFTTEEYWRLTALLAPQGLVAGYTPDLTKSKILARKKAPKDTKNAATEKDADAEEVVETDTGESTDGEKTTPKPESSGLPKPPKGSFFAELSKWNGQEFAAKNEADIDAVMASLQNVAWTITKLEQKDRQEKAPAPFTTSTLQQQANIRLRMSASSTMQAAQKLYEGVDLGSEGSIALITYMRTDSTRISDDALKSVRSHIQSTYGDAYLPGKANIFASGKSAQEAHEAIRPTDLSYTPQRVQPFLKPEQYRLYKLIYDRFVACQMAPAVFAVTNVEVTAGAGLFKAQGKIEKFDGYRRVMPSVSKQDDTTLPSLVEKQLLDRLDLFGTQHFTQPPPRYNEASLVRTLEKEGIGRPSTYASIISVIQTRGYVEQKDRKFFATSVGKVVTDLLVGSFPKIMDLKFTSKMEDELDQIETAQSQYEQVLSGFWQPFSESLTAAKSSMPAAKGRETGEQCPKCGRPLIELFSKKTGNSFVGCSGYREKENPCKYIKPGEGEEERLEPTLTEHLCPKCGKAMIQRDSKKGPFLSCSGYPECKTTMNFGPDGQPVVSAVETEYRCDKCGSPMVLRAYRGKQFLGCSGYPKCRNAMDVDADGKPIRPKNTGIACEKCNSPMIIKNGPRGPFLSCSAYPKCRNAKNLTAEMKEQLKDLLPPAPAKPPEPPPVEITETCPECDAPMKVRMGRGGPFLGCTKYPKCRGTREATPELKEKLAAAAAANKPESAGDAPPA
ncbi:type I DNA topoisomerase [Tuwongella immobilis]|uniref:DNA topoisomerase 1 n=1 Tax=Tuwongella immobilis TaxID=692036 RepID=A0A6C2YU39_9BACT|nr:type I DNA topoisomerase [Tuwongella immobilis]VIP04867.1 dna topoisomerase i : DNA topoisomerase 1 OS=uncultured planctomycete GN=topA PE=3 SV=1: Toprim: Topoisom_bac: zf-C4_Topoisom: zf-C4_Topoisom: zf-C4_Topoisom: zf-C4_Topoisom: zf-C4_Topoisom [Tuwongella immobilis]VTS07093.1 dna topoisomerase i : DNA topoisomerase 1 OS=uncultured planctomycete GN=topA PE=3 SV=1: Toprim: Topoisom_bac: zf-C4_Topoisom: zf-C4_Topoisom: zf-C4_Topoisom: zf-C4_Topoisom: zf-C4_Topoisom [Tuwongella immobilis]